MSKNNTRDQQYRQAIDQLLADVPRLGAEAATLPGRHIIRVVLERLSNALPADAPERNQIGLMLRGPTGVDVGGLTGASPEVQRVIEQVGPAVESARLCSFLAGIVAGVRMARAAEPMIITSQQEAARQAAEDEFNQMADDHLPPKPADVENAPRIAPPPDGWLN